MLHCINVFIASEIFSAEIEIQKYGAWWKSGYIWDCSPSTAFKNPFPTGRKEIPVLSAEPLSVVHSVCSVKKKNVESAEFQCYRLYSSLSIPFFLILYVHTLQNFSTRDSNFRIRDPYSWGYWGLTRQVAEHRTLPLPSGVGERIRGKSQTHGLRLNYLLRTRKGK